MSKPRSTAITPRQTQALEIIKESVRKRGIPPSRSELAEAMGLSAAPSVAGHLNALAQRDLIELHPGTYRGIRLVKAGELPICEVIGELAHHERICDESRIKDHVSGYLADGVSPRPDYFLAIQDPERQEIGSRAGGRVAVAVKEARHAESGTVVVARVDGIVQCKRFTRIDRQYVGLAPMSSDTDQQRVRIDLLEHDFQIDGIVVGTIETRPVPDPA